MNWEELRFFHAVARAGSLAQAARDLKVSQPTVGRRIRDLERRLKTGLFDRLTHGYALTETGRTILEKVEQMACTARSIDDCVSTAAREVAGRVRVTASEGIGAFWLVPQLEQLRRRHPKLDVALMLSTEKLDLSAGAADLALRMGNPKDEKLIGRRIADVAFHLYATRGYFERFGVPTRPEELSGHAIIESAGRLAHLPQGVAIRQLAPGAEIAAAFDSITAQAQAAEAGLGLVPLPPYLVADKPDLLRVPPVV
ncbi:MAG: LysR family transcriptional regulator, partial [Pseudomonadota bacterium]